MRRTPRGTFPPRRWKRSGSLRNCTTSCRSRLAAFSPAMSSKVTFTEVALSNLRLWFLLMPLNGLPDPIIVFARRDIQTQNPMRSAHGRSESRSCTGKDCCWLFTLICTPFWRSRGSSAGSFAAAVVCTVVRVRPASVSGAFNVASRASPPMTTDWTLPSVTSV